MKRKFFVFDTNSLVSAGLITTSVNAESLNKAFEMGQLAFSDANLSEFTEVLFRTKFDRYLNHERRLGIIDRIEQDGRRFRIKETIHACRDSKDDKYLELAIAAKAVCIISGDKDLLVLNPFRNIPILNAADFLKRF